MSIRLRRFATLYALSALLLAPIYFVLTFAARAGLDPWSVAGVGGVSLFLTLLPLAICRTARQALWLYLPVALYAIALVAFVPVLGYWPHEGAAVALVETSLRGYLEFLHAFGPALLVPLVLVGVYLWACLTPGFREIVLDRRLRRGIVLGAVAFGVTAGVATHHLALAPLFGQATFERAYPSAALFDAWRLLPQGNNGKAAQRFHAYEKTLVREREIYVLVMGESSRYGNWQINGYARPTSPRLATYKAHDLLSFPDVTAVANLTLNVWPIALSRATLENQQAAYSEHSVVSLFKEAGYETTWLSNQNSSVGQAFDADRQQFLNYAWQTNWDAFDLALLPLLDETLKAGGAKQFIVLHLMGSHGDYRFRYPKRLDVFGDHAKAGGVYTGKDRQRLVDYYDNTILANDELLDRVVKTVESQHALSTVLFMSDHAENLMDDDRQLVWHGTASSSRMETHIPLFIFPGTRWQQAHPDELQALEANRTKKVSQTSLFATLANIAGIAYPGEDLTRSLASPKYVAPTQRLTMRPDKSLVDVESLR